MFGAGCWVACPNSAIFRSNDWACSAMAAGACGRATGAGFFRTRKMAMSDATRVAILIMRSSLNFFMAILERSAQPRRAQCHGTRPPKRRLDDESVGARYVSMGRFVVLDKLKCGIRWSVGSGGM